MEICEVPVSLFQDFKVIPLTLAAEARTERADIFGKQSPALR